MYPENEREAWLGWRMVLLVSALELKNESSPLQARAIKDTRGKNALSHLLSHTQTNEHKYIKLGHMV